MIERLTDPSESEAAVTSLLSAAVGSARRMHQLEQQQRVDRRVQLTSDHWLLLYFAVRDSLSLSNDEMLQQPENFGEIFDPMQRFEDLRNEYLATGSPATVAGTLAMLDMREALARGFIEDACGSDDYQDDVTTGQMAELGTIGGNIARQVYRALDADTRSQMSPA